MTKSNESVVPLIRVHMYTYATHIFEGIGYILYFLLSATFILFVLVLNWWEMYFSQQLLLYVKYFC